MYEQFTEQARNVMLDADSVAHEWRHPIVTTAHVLYGLTLHGIAGEVLEDELGLEPTLVRAADAGVAATLGGAPRLGPLPLDRRVRRVLARARDEAGLLAQQRVGTEHLLLGLLPIEGPHWWALCRARTAATGHKVVVHDEVREMLRSAVMDKLSAPLRGSRRRHPHRQRLSRRDRLVAEVGSQLEQAREIIDRAERLENPWLAVAVPADAPGTPGRCQRAIGLYGATFCCQRYEAHGGRHREEQAGLLVEWDDDLAVERVGVLMLRDAPQ